MSTRAEPRFVQCTITGDVLRFCRCGTPLDDELVVRNGRCQTVWLVADATSTDTRAEFYHEACWLAYARSDAFDQTLVAFPVPWDDAIDGRDPTGAAAPVRRHCAAAEECAFGGALPNSADARASLVAQVEELCGRTVAVYHAECASQTPVMEFVDSDSRGASLSQTVADAITRALKQGVFGARHETRVAVVGGGLVLPAPEVDRALATVALSRAEAVATLRTHPSATLSRVVLCEPMGMGHGKLHLAPPTMRHLSRAPACVPWSFECFLRATRTSPIHCASWVWCTPREFERAAELLFGRGGNHRLVPVPVGSDPNEPQWCVILHTDAPSEQEWFAYIGARIVGGSSMTSFAHPFAPLAKYANRGDQFKVVHGLDVYRDASATVYLASGVYPANPADGDSTPRWRTLPPPAYLRI